MGWIWVKSKMKQPESSPYVCLEGSWKKMLVALNLGRTWEFHGAFTASDTQTTPQDNQIIISGRTCTSVCLVLFKFRRWLLCAAKVGTHRLNETPQVPSMLGAQWVQASSCLTHFLLLPPPLLNLHRIALHLSWSHHTRERWLPKSWRILFIFMLKETGLSSHFLCTISSLISYFYLPSNITQNLWI